MPIPKRESPNGLLALALVLGLGTCSYVLVRVLLGYTSAGFGVVLLSFFAVGGVLGYLLAPQYPQRESPIVTGLVAFAMGVLYLGWKIGKTVPPVGLVAAAGFVLLLGWAVVGLVRYSSRMRRHHAAQLRASAGAPSVDAD